MRWKNVSGTEDYIARVVAGRAAGRRDAGRCRRLERQRKRSSPACGLQEASTSAAVGARYGVDAWGRFGPALAPFIAAGVVLREGDRIRLTREGMLVANEIMAVFV